VDVVVGKLIEMAVVVAGNLLEEEMPPTIELIGKRRVEVRLAATEKKPALLPAKNLRCLREERKV
jgi:hypothetical protein